MIDANKLEYFTMAAWLRGYAEGLDADEYKTSAISEKLLKAANMLDYVFNSEINRGE